MLGDAVTKSSCENLTSSWPCHDEAERLAGLIGAVMDFTDEPPKVFLEVRPVLTALFCPQLTFQTIKIGINPSLFLLITKCDHRPDRAGIVLVVVVVDLAITAMEIPRVRGVKR